MIAGSVRQFGNFSDHEILLLEDALIKKSISKSELLLKKGETCKSVYFIIRGAFIQYNFKDEIDQNIIDLHLENEWMLNHQSFVQQKPSETFIEAYHDSTVYELTVQKLHQLIGSSPVFFQLGKILEPAISRIHLFDNQLTPLEKYQFVLDSRYKLLQFFPLKIIASYLKITPETLSRVREKISSEKKRF